MEQMRGISQVILAGTLALVVAAPGRETVAQGLPPAQSSSEPSAQKPSALPKALIEFDASANKFGLDALMKILRDSRHEGWVLAAYPDPKTSRPLIGAGFSLDVEERDHVQTDPFNPHTFIEPSSAQLWQAAGLDEVRLQRILDQFERNLKKWNKKSYRKKIKANKLPPDVTNAEAMELLRVSALQAIHNARAYCRDFDQLTAAQQMAMSQLVFQMGVNLEEFVQFLSVLNNNDAGIQNASLSAQSNVSEVEHWKAVQQSLIESQWARRYSSRAISVIAMFDPNYAQNPAAAERQIQAVLHPPGKHHRKKPRVDSVQAANQRASGKATQ
jgi:hypothetical protein